MTEMALAIDEELLSPNEVAPKPSKPSSDLGCRVDGCSEGPFANPARRGYHEWRAHGVKGSSKKATGAKKTPAAKKATAAVRKAVTPERSKRTPAGDTLGEIVSGGAQLIDTVDPLMGGVLEFQAIATGYAIDKVVAGTKIDTWAVQPLATGAAKWKDLGDCLSLPAMMLMIRAHPPFVVPLEKHLRRAIGGIMAASLPAIRKEAAEQQRVAAALVELGELDPSFAGVEDPVGFMLQKLLAPILVAEGAETGHAGEG